MLQCYIKDSFWVQHCRISSALPWRVLQFRCKLESEGVLLHSPQHQGFVCPQIAGRKLQAVTCGGWLVWPERHGLSWPIGVVRKTSINHSHESPSIESIWSNREEFKRFVFLFVFSLSLSLSLSIPAFLTIPSMIFRMSI